MTNELLERVRRKARQQAFDGGRIGERSQRLLKKTRERLADSWRNRPEPNTITYADTMWL